MYLPLCIYFFVFTSLYLPLCIYLFVFTSLYLPLCIYFFVYTAQRRLPIAAGVAAEDTYVRRRAIDVFAIHVFELVMFAIHVFELVVFARDVFANTCV